MYNKANFNCGDLVFIHSTTDIELDGQFVEIIGKSSIGIIDFYIVMLERSVFRDGFEYRAITIPEVCLLKQD